MEKTTGVKQKEFDYKEHWQVSDELGLFDKNELPVSPTVKIIRKYSDKTSLPDLSPEEMLDWQEMAYQLFKKDYKEIADIGRVKTEVRLIVKDFKKIETEETVHYSGDIKYRIYTVDQEKKEKDYRNFEKVKVMTVFGVYETNVDTSAFNTSDFERQKPKFDKFGYKVAKLREKLMEAVITYSVHVESNNPRQEAIEIAKQKLLSRYNTYIKAKQEYLNRRYD